MSTDTNKLRRAYETNNCNNVVPCDINHGDMKMMYERNVSVDFL